MRTVFFNQKTQQFQSLGQNCHQQQSQLHPNRRKAFKTPRPDFAQELEKAMNQSNNEKIQNR